MICKYSGCSGLTSVTIPGRVTSIGESAFYDCIKVASVTISASVTSIGSDAFSGCLDLASVYITDIGSWCKISFSNVDSNPLYHANHLYMNESVITNLVIPDGVTSIGDWAFEGCSDLTSVTIPGSVTSIGKSAFEDCSGLTSVTIPEGVKSIEEGTFRRCSSMTSVTIPGSVKSIENNAFNGCSSLTSVSIPSGVTGIRYGAFAGCNGLTSVTIYTPSLYAYGESAFEGNASGRKIYVFNNCVDTYKSRWTIYRDDIEAITITAKEGETGEYWSTYYNDMANAKAPTGTQVFKAALSGTTLTLTEIPDGIITKGQGVVLKSNSSTIQPEHSASGSATSYTDNRLFGTMTSITNPGDAYVLNKKTAGVGFYKLSDSGTVGANKAYLTYSGAFAREFFGFSETTGVDSPKSSPEGKDLLPLLQEGTGEAWYDLSGRRVAQPTKGLYIINGKKVVNK